MYGAKTFGKTHGSHTIRRDHVLIGLGSGGHAFTLGHAQATTTSSVDHNDIVSNKIDDDSAHIVSLRHNGRILVNIAHDDFAR